MATGCPGGALDSPSMTSGGFGKTIGTRSKSPSSRSRWRPCRVFRMTRTWWSRPPRPPTVPAPALVRCSNEDEERTLVVSRARGLARTGTVAILIRTREQEKAVPQHLRNQATRLHRDLQRWPTDPGLFYGTYHAAKGLEFDTVFLPFLSDDGWPYPPDVQNLGPQEAAARNARLLYVGITRARSTLVMTYSGRVTHLLPENEGLYQR